MSKLSFRARALDALKPMPIFMAEELPGLPEFSAINRALPQMPSVMQKEEECELHLQAAMEKKLIIPTPEVSDITDSEIYDKLYPANYKQPKQLIHMQPFAMEQDIPDYDMDSEDEKWVEAQSRKLNLTHMQFEEMLDRLEKNSEQTVIKLHQAKEILKENEDLIIAVYDYWLNKRLKTQHPLLLAVRTELRGGSAAANNPYLAFRRRTEKMQTRKHRKNDETSYEKMLKLRRDLNRAVTLLEMVKKRENLKREHLSLTIEIYEKRYQAQDFSGQLLSEVSALKASRPAFAPLFTNQFGVHQNWSNKVCGKDDIIPRKEKRQYKKRKHKSDVRSGGLDDGSFRGGLGTSGSRGNRVGLGSGLDPLASSDEDGPLLSHTQPSSLPSDRDDEDTPDEGQFAFRRSKNNSYLPPVSGGFGNWPWCSKEEGGLADKRYRFALTSITKPTPKCIGYARRRIGRGGRVILDRYSNDMDDIWSSLDYTIHEPKRDASDPTALKHDWLHFRPKTPPPVEQSPSEESSSSDSEEESATRSQPEALPYPFPPEATSICVDFETDRMDDESPFTSEFNIADYFSMDTLSDFDLALSTDICAEMTTDNSDWRTEELGCSRVRVLPKVENVFVPPVRPTTQCSASSANSVNTSSCSNATTSSASTSTTNSGSGSNNSNNNNNNNNGSGGGSQSATGPSTSASTQCTSVEAQLNNNQTTKSHRQLLNNSTAASILSKSLTSPTNNRSSGAGGVRVIGTGTITSASSSGSSSGTNCGNGHQNGPVTLVQNAKSLPNSTHIVNNQSTILLSQKHTPSNLLPGLNRLASLARQQQQQQTQNQAQQIPTSGEITLNSNSERLEMEVDGVQNSPCDGKPQQQQLVRASKANSLAMEVT